MRHLRSVLVIVLVSWPFVSSADPVLEKLIEQGLAARPELAQVQALAQAEHERAPRLGVPPDPVLQLGVQNDGFKSWEVGKMESSWFSVMMSQSIAWPGRLRLESEIAELGAKQADERITRARLSTEAEVRRAYLGLIFARDRLALLNRLETTWSRAVAITRSRYETGQGAQSDLLRAQLEQNRIRQRRLAIQADLDSALQTLNRLRGHPLDEPIETSAHLDEMPLPAIRDVSEETKDALDRSPELAAARLQTDRAEQSTSLARRSYIPSFTVSAGVMLRGANFPPMWQASIGFPIPIFAGSKQNRETSESEARIVAAKSDVDSIEQVLALRVGQRQASLRATLASLRLYREGLLLQSEAAASSTLSQYEVGKVPFTSALEANAGFIADLNEQLALILQAQRLEIDRAEVSLAPVQLSESGMGTSAVSSVQPTETTTAKAAAGAATSGTAGGSSSSMPSM